MKPVIIGAGVAGLSAALECASMPVILLSPTPLATECSSAWAQGGIAAAVGADDSPALHAMDTLAAAAGLGDEAATNRVTAAGLETIEFLLRHGAPFDRDENRQLILGLEAAHSRRRIVHVADHTGASVTEALALAARRTPSIDIWENVSAEFIHTRNGRVVGLTIKRGNQSEFLATSRVVLATGGAGALWQETSNPLGSWGKGLWLAAQAGAMLGDMEFMQFHPTAIDIGRDPMPLASEALRGEGCTLIDEKNERFVEELKPRDIVARAIFQKRAGGHKVFLDGRAALGKNFAAHFPTIYTMCLSAGIDPATAPIPVAPAAHYHMGGVVTDSDGRTNVPGLWACGEVANTGLHGANRLASNSLLEAAQFGRCVAQSLKGVPQAGSQSASPYQANNNALDASTVRRIMSAHVGVLRNREGLLMACDRLSILAPQSRHALVGLMIAVAALRRDESRGGHARTDFPASNPAWQRRQTITLAELSSYVTLAQRRANGA